MANTFQLTDTPHDDYANIIKETKRYYKHFNPEKLPDEYLNNIDDDYILKKGLEALYEKLHNRRVRRN